MKLSHNGKVFVAISTYAERGMLGRDGAGFQFHGHRYCGSGCRGCSNSVPPKHWWTDNILRAARLSEYADDKAKAALAAHEEKTAASKAATRNGDDKRTIPVPDGLSYFPFQDAGTLYAHDTGNCLIADEMGLGKTIQAIGLVNMDTSINNVLVIVPSSLRLNWKREFEKWLTRPLKVYAMPNTEAKTKGRFMTPADDDDVIILNAEKLVSGRGVKKRLEMLRARDWDLIIIDEVHRFKNPDARRTKTVLGFYNKKLKKRIEGLADRAKRKLYLTGTPIQNRPLEAWPIVSSLWPDVFDNFWQFVTRYCDAHQERVPTRGGWKNVWKLDGSSNLEELQEKLRGTGMIRRLKSQVLTELPPKLRAIVHLDAEGYEDLIDAEFELFRAHEDEYNVWNDRAHEALEKGDTDSYFTAIERLRVIQKAAFEEMSHVRVELAVRKAPDVIAVVDDALEQKAKVSVFAHHKKVISQLKAHWGDAAVVLDGDTPNEKRDEAVQRFQHDPSVRVFIGSIQAAGVGLTLTAASDTYFAEIDWVPANMTQAEDRHHRISQQNTVNVNLLVVDGSLDAHMAKTIVQKQAIADAALDLDTKIKAPVPAKTVEARTAEEFATVPANGNGNTKPKWPVATAEERDAVARGLQFLAGRCDGAVAEDNMGFNKFDFQFGKDLANKSAARPLTDGQVGAGRKLLRKYRGQISYFDMSICDTLELYEPTEKQKAEKDRKRIEKRIGKAAPSRTENTARKEAEAKEKREAAQAVREQAEAAQDALDLAQNELDEHVAARGKAEGALSAAHREFTRVVEQYEAAERRFGDARREIAALEEKLARAKSTLQGAAEERRDLQSQKHQLRGRVDKAAEVVGKHTTEIASWSKLYLIAEKLRNERFAEAGLDVPSCPEEDNDCAADYEFIDFSDAWEEA